jgi:DNA-binding NarL/FixJ family response regulator
VVSRDIILQPFFKKLLESYGFTNVITTALDRDALDSLLRELKPGLVIIEARFYECSTPYMMSELLHRLPKLNLNIAVVSLERYPAKRARAFIGNGIKSFLCLTDGIEEFKKGLRLIRDGKNYISPAVQKIGKSQAMPKAAQTITPRHHEVIRLNGNGFTTDEISKALNIAVSTVYNHKQEIFNSFAVRNEREMFRTARELGIISDDELVFYGENVETKKRKRQSMSNANNE